jgi:hypothetical protein
MKTLVRYFIVVFLVLPVIGCKIDPEYDFSNLDTTVTVLKGAEFPVPNARILLREVFPLENNDFVICDESGNYLIDVALDPIDLQFYIPESGPDRVSVDFEPVQYTFDAVPDFLSGKDQRVVLDLSDMQVDLRVDSDIPAEFSIGTAIESIRSGAVSRRCSIDGLNVAYGSNQYVFVEEKSSSDPDYYRAVPGLGELFSPIPDAVRIGTVEVYADAEQRALAAHDRLYHLSCLVSAESPIKFAEGTRFILSAPLNASLNLDEIGLKKAVLSLQIENSMPLDFSFTLHAFDASGNRLDSIQVAPDFESIPALGRTNGSITLTTAGDLRFSGLELELTASVPASLVSSEYYGTCLNRNQGLNMTGMSLYLPDGIQIKLNPSSGNK